VEVAFLHLFGEFEIGGRVAVLGLAQQSAQADRRQAVRRMSADDLAHAGQGRSGLLGAEAVEIDRVAPLVEQLGHVSTLPI